MVVKDTQKNEEKECSCSEAVMQLSARIEVLAAELVKMGERVDSANRLVKTLVNEGSALQKAQQSFARGLDVLEATLKLKTVALEDAQATTDKMMGVLEDAQATTDKMMGVLDTRVGRLRNEVIEEKEARLASTIPPPPSSPTLPEDRKTDPLPQDRITEPEEPDPK
jgi:polyhydroxyalkanoate synthesis regulator phasin